MIIIHTQNYVMNFGNPRNNTLKIDIHQHLKEVSHYMEGNDTG